MAPLFAEFAPIARFRVRTAVGIRPAFGFGFVPKSRRTILLRNPNYGAKSRHTILIGISAGVVMCIDIAS